MTENQFNKRCYRPYMEIYHINYKRMKVGFPESVIPCMLIAIDFDEGLFKLSPYPDTPYPEDRSFWAHYNHCSFNSDKLRIVKK